MASPKLEEYQRRCVRIADPTLHIHDYPPPLEHEPQRRGLRLPMWAWTILTCSTLVAAGMLVALVADIIN